MLLRSAWLLEKRIFLLFLGGGAPQNCAGVWGRSPQRKKIFFFLFLFWGAKPPRIVCSVLGGEAPQNCAGDWGRRPQYVNRKTAALRT